MFAHMDFERDVNIAVQTIIKHIKAVIDKNLVNAIRMGHISIDESKVRGLSLLIGRSIDEGYVQAGRELNEVLKAGAKAHNAALDEAKQVSSKKR